MNREIAIVLLIEGELLENLEMARERLKKAGVSWLTEHGPVQHLTLLSGTTDAPDELVAATEDLVCDVPPFHIPSSGIGVFALERPVIYLRWPPGGDLRRLHARLRERTESYWSALSELNIEPHWLPKTSIALNDTTLNALPLLLSCLENLNFRQDHKFTKIAIIDFGGSHEEIIATFELGERHIS